MNSVSVPPEFQPGPLEPPYVRHQVGPLIEPYFARFQRENAARFPDGITYLPVFWTAYNLGHDFARRPLRRLQQFLDETLEPGRRYFTLVQDSDGIYNVLPDGVTVFSPSRGDVSIPLLCDPHPVRPMPRDVFASFIGAMTHWTRRHLAELAREDSRFVVREGVAGPSGTALFRGLMQRSEFALCPRGHGPTSFRLYEALQMGAIPVYVSDDHRLPFADELDWRRIAVIVHSDEIPHLPRLLDGIPEPVRKQMRADIHELWPRYFSFEGCSERILERVRGLASGEREIPAYGRSRNERRFLDEFRRRTAEGVQRRD